jgi:acyl dehydratase
MTHGHLYFEDLKVGDIFKTATHLIDFAQIQAFAREFDPQPFHLDPHAAKASVFGGLAASGWHTAALTMRLLVTSGPPLAGGIVGVSMGLEWKIPTRAGDLLQVECEVVSLAETRSRPHRGIVMMACRTLNQRGALVQSLTATLMIPRRVC